MTPRTFARFVLLSATVGAAACGSSPTPTTPTDTGTSLANLFTGTVAVRGVAFYSFTVSGSGTSNLAVTLASLTTAAGATLPTSMTLGLGVPKGTGCGVTQSVSAAPGLKAQLAAGLAAGIYCVNVADAGGLTDTTNFSIRILVSNNAAAPTPAASTDTWASNLAVGGVATRSFPATQSGSLTVTLQSTAGATIGFGVGLWDGINCGVTRFGPATAGAVIALDVDPGTYCVKLTDLGSLTSTIPFSITIAHP